MAVLDRAVKIPRGLLLYLWELEGLGQAPQVLGARDLYIPQEETGEYAAELFRLLQDQGVAHGDMPTRELRVALRVLSQPNRELYCRTEIPGGNRQFAVAAAGGEAVAVHVRGDIVRIVGCNPDTFVDDFLTELPDFGPATIPELRVPQAAYDQRRDNHDMFAARPAPEQQLDQLMKAPRLGVHAIRAGAIVDGRFRSAPFTVLDIRGHGRIVTFTDPRGEIRCLPGSPANLTQTFAAAWQSL